MKQKKTILNFDQKFAGFWHGKITFLSQSKNWRVIVWRKMYAKKIKSIGRYVIEFDKM